MFTKLPRRQKVYFTALKVARTYFLEVLVMFLNRVFRQERFNQFLWAFASLKRIVELKKMLFIVL